MVRRSILALLAVLLISAVGIEQGDLAQARRAIDTTQTMIDLYRDGSRKASYRIAVHKDPKAGQYWELEKKREKTGLTQTTRWQVASVDGDTAIIEQREQMTNRTLAYDFVMAFKVNLKVDAYEVNVTQAWIGKPGAEAQQIEVMAKPEPVEVDPEHAGHKEEKFEGFEFAGKTWKGTLRTFTGDGWFIKEWIADNGWFSGLLKTEDEQGATQLTALGEDARPLLKLPGEGESWPRDGSKENPLILMLVPADGGTEESTRKDFEPLFKKIAEANGVHFEIRVGQSYGAVVDAHVNGQIDLAFYGLLSFMEAKERDAVELLAVCVNEGESVYYSCIFVSKDSAIKELKDLKGKSMAFGDPSSNSSFSYPLAMLIDAGVDPVKDLRDVVLAGSHVNSLKACAEGKVDACAASHDSLERAVTQKHVVKDALRSLAKSKPIPNPALAMHMRLPAEIKRKLREVFKNAHKAEGVKPEMIRGYGGKKCDCYDTEFSEADFITVAANLEKAQEIKAEVLAKAAE